MSDLPDKFKTLHEALHNQIGVLSQINLSMFQLKRGDKTSDWNALGKEATQKVKDINRTISDMLSSIETTLLSDEVVAS